MTVHMQVDHFQQGFARQRRVGLKLQKKMCDVFTAHLKYLGHLLLGQGIRPLPKNSQNIKTLLQPYTSKRYSAK